MSQFFSNLKKTGIDQYGISILFDEDSVSVSLLPRSSAKDTAFQALKPLTVHGTVQEVDERFFEILQKPLERTKALFDNTTAFEQNLEETEQRTQQAKKKKESTSKKAAELKELLKEKDFNPMVDHRKATDLAHEILKIDPNHQEAKKVINDMKSYDNPQLFQ